MGAKQSFVGVWDLVSFEARLSDGRVITPLGEDAVGRVIYDADGRMSVQIMRRDRPAFASGDMLKGESEEVRAAFEGYIAYSGTYEVREDDACVLHRVEASLFPNWIGGEQVRFFEFPDGRLKLSTPSLVYGGGETTSVLIWERAK
jgi:hypothetical protein